MGNYAPLKPSIGIKCRFCGIGKYQRVGQQVTDKTVTLRDNRSMGADGQIVTANVMQCEHCGHLELFNFQRTGSWWNQ
jgi:hypothetical protein